MEKNVLSLREENALKMARIDGEIPTIDSKNAKMEVLYLYSRKTFPYILRNGLHSLYNRKTSAYFTFDNYLNSLSVLRP
jgi:hypothetical protein